MLKIQTVSRLENFTALGDNVKVYVPSTMNVNEKIDSKKFVESIKISLSNLFGGCTSYNASGAWYSDEKESLILEGVTIVQAFTSALDNDSINAVIELCEMLKSEMVQECISLEINNKLYFI